MTDQPLVRDPAHHLALASLADDQLAWAARSVVDRGFGWLTDEGVPDRARPAELWITARMTHVFALASAQGDDRWAAELAHGVTALTVHFVDPEFGGWVPTLGPELPAYPKRLYDHAFVILAGSSLMVADVEGGRELLEQALATVDAHFWEPEASLARESFVADWSVCEDYRGVNANMHLVEAYLAAGHATGDVEMYRRALGIASRVVNEWARVQEWRIPEHFTAAWVPLPDYNLDRVDDPFRPFGITPGHGLEWARLLLHLETVLEPSEAPWLRDAAIALARRALADGWLEPGGIVYTTDHDGVPVVEERFHWVTCEALAATAVLEAVTNDREWADWYERIWLFALQHLIAPDGAWIHELGPSLELSQRTWAGRPDVYHAYQALMIPRAPVTVSVMASAQAMRFARDA